MRLVAWDHENDGYFKAHLSGQLWNGWEVPSFEWDEVVRIADVSNKSDGCHDFTLDEVAGTVKSRSEYDDDTDPDAEWPAGERYGVKTWPIGAGSWTWYDCTEQVAHTRAYQFGMERANGEISLGRTDPDPKVANIEIDLSNLCARLESDLGVTGLDDNEEYISHFIDGYVGAAWPNENWFEDGGYGV